jgi:hypothetical protein
MQKFELEEQSSLLEHNGATFFIDLPTKGKFYSEDHPFHNKEQIELKMMTTREEEILTNPSYIENNLTIDKLLQSVLNIPTITTADLFEVDQYAILIGLRIDAYDENYKVVAACSNCEEEYPFSIDLDKMREKVNYSDLEETPNNTFVVKLPKSNRTVEFKLVLPKEILSVQKTTEKLSKMNVKTNFTQEFLKRIVVSVDGDTDSAEKDKFLRFLRIMDSRFLMSAYEKGIPELDLSVTSTCPHCNHQQEGGMPIQANFFFPEF